MIVDRIHAAFKASAAAKKNSANPTGSRLGACTAQLQMLAFPRLSKPEPWQPRGAAVTEEGRVLEQWLGEKIHAAWPGKWGLREQPFYFPVPIPETVTRRVVKDGQVADLTMTAAEAIARIEERLRQTKDDRSGSMFFGWPIDGFKPPMVKYKGTRERDGAQRQVWETRGIRQGPDGRPERYQPSIVLDRTGCEETGIGPKVWIACYVDGIILHPDLGPVLVEQKEMSNFAFRRSLMGNMEYRYRCQLIAALVATGFESAVWVCHRKETSHLAEITFTREAAQATVKVTAWNGAEEVFFVADAKRELVIPSGAKGEEARPRPLTAPGQWDYAEVWTPYNDEDLISMRQRALDVLLAEPNQWKREYGPEFTCRSCGGHGDRPCSNCKGSGKSGKKQGPCGVCSEGKAHATGTVGRVKCEPLRSNSDPKKYCNGEGSYAEVELPAYPCGYCPAVMFCWAGAGVRREIDTRPHHYVKRDAYLKSGLAFFPPETPEPVAVIEEEGEEVALEVAGVDE